LEIESTVCHPSGVSVTTMSDSLRIAEMPGVNSRGQSAAAGEQPRRGGALHALGRSWNWLKWPVAIGILVGLYFHNQKALNQIAAAPKNWSYAFLALGLLGCSSLITFSRWYLLVRGQGFPFRFRDAVRYGFVGMVMSYVSVGTAGGDLFKAFLLAKDQSSRRAVAVATVLLDRILGLLALFIVGVVATLLPHDFSDSPEVQANTLVLWGGTLAGLAGVGFLLLPAPTQWGWVQRLPNLPVVGHIIGELIHGVKLYQSQPQTLLAALGLSLIGHLGLITGFYFCAQCMQQPWIPTLTAHYYFMPNAELFGVVSMTPAGIGALEWAVQTSYILLNPGTVTEEQAGAAGLAAALAFRVVSMAVAAIGAIYYVSSRSEISAAVAEAEHEAQSVESAD
jgi:uncharacterized membrane protein YbhN (UPF0104 family)